MNKSYSITELPFPQFIGIKHAKKFKLDGTLFLEQWRVPAGTVVELYCSQNFGICVLPEGTKDERGFILPRRIFR